MPQYITEPNYLDDIMKVEILEDEPKSLILEFDESDRAVAELIKDEIIDNKDVEFAAVVKEHPEVGRPRLVVKASKKPSTIVAKAIENVEAKLKEFESKLPKK